MQRSFILRAPLTSSGGWVSTAVANALLWCNYRLNPLPPPPALCSSTPAEAISWSLSGLLSPSTSTGGDACTAIAALTGSTLDLANAFYPFYTLLICGGVARLLLSLPFTCYGEWALRQLRAARPSLCEAYAQYTAVAHHPRAIAWERRVATQQLVNARREIFRRYRVNNFYVYLPFLASGVINLCLLAGPMSAVLGPALTGGAVWCPSPLAIPIGTSTAICSSSFSFVDPTIALASGVTWVNLRQHLKRRDGLGLKADKVRLFWEKWNRNIFLYAGVSSGIAALPLGLLSLSSSSVVAGSASSLLVTLPSYVGPAWLGMALMTLVKNILHALWGRVRQQAHDPATAASTAAFFLASDSEAEAYQQQQRRGESPLDSTSPAAAYAIDTSAFHPYTLNAQDEDAKERRAMWQLQKKMLEYECDVRLFRLVKRLWTPAEEAEEEAEKLGRKAEVARRLSQSDRKPSGAVEGEHTQSTSLSREEAAELQKVMEAERVRNEIYEKKFKTETS